MFLPKQLMGEEPLKALGCTSPAERVTRTHIPLILPGYEPSKLKQGI